MKVAVFGGASAKPGEKVYEEARQLGKLIGDNGHTVLTGGYIGVMEAASRGANEAGGHVIGVTCTQIERWRNTRANQWVKEEWNYATLRERMYALIDSCDVAVVMPGGVGTLAELSVMWNELIINHTRSRPLILVGDDWIQLLRVFFQSFGSFIGEKDRSLVSIAVDADEVIQLISAFQKI